MIPEGRLTLIPGSPKMSADVTSSALWYSPKEGGNWPFWDSVNSKWTEQSFMSGPTDQNGPSLSVSSVASGAYHVFGSSAGLVLGNPWGAANPQSLLTHLAGHQVDPTTNNPWLGSINVGTAGQLTCHFSEGLSRRFDVYNAHQQEDIDLRVVPAQANYCPTNQYPNFVPFNNDATTCATICTGDNEVVECTYTQVMFINTSNGIYGIVCAIGWDGAYAGSWIIFSDDMQTLAAGETGVAHHVNPAALGVHNVSMLVAAAVNSGSRGSALWGRSSAYTPFDNNALLTVKYKG